MQKLSELLVYMDMSQSLLNHFIKYNRIAGWKQQQHPVLYYAFHVGDQVVKIAGVTVQNSAEAQRAIKMVSSMQVLHN